MRLSSEASFVVDDVTPAANPIFVEPLATHVSKRFRRKVHFLPHAEKGVINTLWEDLAAMTLSPENRVKMEATAAQSCHPLIDAVATAFRSHRPLILSPDSIWMVIQQGFSHHVAENSAALRSRLVQHEGKRELSARLSTFDLAGFETAISGFSDQIRSASDPVLHETLLCDFSTTTPTIRTASEVVLMDCYSTYFDYILMCVCGIPRITVTGTREDWERIRARIEVLATYELEWWVDRLRPILDEFLHTVSGQPDRSFWQAIYKPRKAYGSTSVTGWIADLFPYLNDPPQRRRNHIFNHVRKDWSVTVENGVQTRGGFGDPEAAKGVGQDSFPSGLSSVPVKLKLPGGSFEKVDLVAGFLAVQQDPDLALSPVISWAVTEPPPEKPVLLY